MLIEVAYHRMHHAETALRHRQEIIPSQPRDLARHPLHLLIQHRIVWISRVVYPITRSDLSIKALWAIRGIPLPHAHQLLEQRQQDEEIATALGYVVHCLQFILFHVNSAQLPLYPMLWRGNRSLILDNTADTTTDSLVEYPLYAYRQDTNRYQSAVFLLNCNLERLLKRCGAVTAVDYRKTLPNLSLLIQLLTTSSSSC